MTEPDKRLDRLYPALTAKERAILTLVDSREGRPQDHKLRYTAPEEQMIEFNHLVGLINAASGDLAHLILLQHEKVAQTAIRFAWLTSLRRYGLECARVRIHLLLDLDEPITQSAFKLREQESRANWIPIGECAEMLAERHDWTDGGLVDHDGVQRPEDKAWRRMIRESIARLRSLVDNGTLVGRGNGSRMKIACGSFFDWLGEPVPVIPAWGIDVEVFPDHQAKTAEGLSKRRTEVLGLMDRLAVSGELPFDLERPLQQEPSAEDAFDDDQRMLAISIRAEVLGHGLQLLAHELVVNEMAAEFVGEDVLHPDVRDVFDQTKATLLELHGRIQRYTGNFELPIEPDEETLASVRRIVAREVRG